MACNQVKYLVRLDDACPTMDWVKWQRIEELLDENDIKPMVGVIPNNEDELQVKDEPHPDFWSIVKRWEDKGWAIALHGNHHTYRQLTDIKGLNPINNYSEFVGKSLDEQRALIRDGWSTFLKNGIEPKYFFAPAHTFDENTLNAIKEETNIRIISDTIAANPYVFNEFVFIPQQMGFFRAIKLPGVWSTCLHPSEMQDSDFNHVEKFLLNYKDRFIGFDELNLQALKNMTSYDYCLKSIYFFMRTVKTKLKITRS